MPSRDEVFDFLVGLPDPDYVSIVFQVDSTRRDRLEEMIEEQLPAMPDRDTVAKWLARKHLAIDPGLEEIYYLSAGPSREIHLLEVNRLLPLPEPADGQLNAVDFDLDLDGVDLSLFVVDTTPEQWRRALSGDYRLPQGWKAEPRQRFSRGD